METVFQFDLLKMGVLADGATALLAFALFAYKWLQGASRLDPNLTPSSYQFCM